MRPSLVVLLLAGALTAFAAVEVRGPSPGDALARLTAGNARFAGDHTQQRAHLASLRHDLVAGQHPSAIILSCSDSRVPPEMVFDQSLGDLFVVRLAGEVPGPEAIASIEYAVEQLGVNYVVVLGHTNCGAVKAAVTSKPGASSGSPDLDHLVESIRQHLGSDVATLEKDPVLREAAQRNARAIADGLGGSSPIIREAAKDPERRLRIVPALYDLESGTVDFFDRNGRP